jgi:hypothetical protein
VAVATVGVALGAVGLTWWAWRTDMDLT